MGTRIYVGNLSYDTDNQGLRQFFEAGGCTVTDVHVVMDRETGRSRGFAFVEVGDDGQCQLAIRELDGKELDGRRLAVSEARPRQPREGGGGGPRGPGRGNGGPPRDRFDRRGGGRPGPIVDRARPARSAPSDSAPMPRGGFDKPPPVEFGPPPDPFDESAKDPGRRRKQQKKKKKHHPDEEGFGDGGGRRRRGGRKNRFDDDDW